MSKPTAEEWEQAVTNIFEHYPAEIFPPDSDSPDAKAGTWARKICLSIITEAWRLNTEHYAAQSDGSECGKVQNPPGP